MTKRLKQLGWKVDGKSELLLKQMYAYIFHALGFTINLNLQQIKHGPYVDSLVKKDKGNYQELPPAFVNEQNILVFNNILEELLVTKIYKSKFNLDSESSIFNDNIERYLPLRTHSVFDKYNIEDMQVAFFSCFKNDSMDTPLMRYLIVNKYNLDKALNMCVKHLNWRINVHPIDYYAMDGDYKLYKEDPESQIIYSLKLNHVYIRGVDRKKRPIVTVEVYKHFRNDCSDEDFEKIMCLIIEWTKLKLSESKNVNRGTLLFDLTDFSLANADFHAVRFLVNTFQQIYPEYLGSIIIHNAPWIFYTVWKVFRTWMDPLLFSKVTFTFRYTDLEKLIEPQHIPVRLGGEDDFKFEYVIPTKENSALKQVDDNFKQLFHKRCSLYLQFIESTISWVRAETQTESYNFLIQRILIEKQLAKNYIELDPYIRSRGIFDRNGEIDKIGY